MANIPYNLGHDGQGHSAFALQPPNVIYTATLGSDDSSFTVPSTYPNTWIAVFRYQAGINFYVCINGDAAVPGGSSFAASTSELNPPAYQLNSGDVIDIITAAADGGDVSVALYTNN